MAFVAVELFQADVASEAATVSRGPYLQTATANGIVVRWRTDVLTDSRVRYGTDPFSLDLIADDANSTREHVITLNGLTPETKYFYDVGTTTQRLVGGDAQHYFLTPPATGTAKPTRIWVIGDSGHAGPNSAAVRDAFLGFAGTNCPSLWLLLGDNAYGNGTDAEYQEGFFDSYPTVLRNTAVWPTIGNHDAGASNVGTETGPYFDMFTLPAQAQAGGVPSGTEAYYSFDHGNIHFVCLTSQSIDRSVNGPMMTWLNNDLAATTNEWLIAYWHHPPYSKGSHDSDTQGTLVEMRENAVPILEAHGVDLVLSGHSHSYERSKLIDGHYGFSSTLQSSMIKDGGTGREDDTGPYRKTTAPRQGAVYTVAGSASSVSNGGNLDHPVMVVGLAELGSVVLDVDGLRLDAKFIASNGLIRDHFTIVKEPPLSVTRGPYLQRATPTSIVIRWRTDSPSDSRVRYGTGLAQLNFAAGDSSLTTEHEVTLAGLSPDTSYYYSVGTSAQAIAGGAPGYQFITPPQSGTARQTRVWILGDSGMSAAGAAAVRDAYQTFAGADPATLLVMLGGIAGPNGDDAAYQSALFDRYPSILRNTVSWPAFGDDDAGDSLGLSGPYYDVFTLPMAGEAGGIPSGTEAYYSFDHGNIHFVCLESAQIDRSVDGSMLTWLENDLAATTNLWIIAFWHSPPYSKGSHDSELESPSIEMRANALSILDTHGVDLVLSGHSHSYERSKLIYGHYGSLDTLTADMIRDAGDGREDGTGAYEKYTPEQQGAVFAVAGSAGLAESGSFGHPVMITNMAVLGSMLLDVNGGRLDARFIDGTGAVLDWFTIRKGEEPPGPPPPPPSVTISATDSNASETGLDAGAFTVTRIGSTNERLTIFYVVTGTASMGNDYVTLSAVVTIPAAATTAQIAVTPINDSSIECPETIVVTLGSGTNYTLAAPSNATVTLSDNDLPRVKVTVPDASASEPGSNTGSFKVSRDGCTGVSLTVFYSLSGSASSGVDYGLDPSNTGAITIPSGSSSMTIKVKPINDNRRESKETVILTLAPNNSYQIITPNKGTVSIADND